MKVLVNGKLAATTSTSKLLGIDSKEEAILFEQSYRELGFIDVRSEAEYKGPDSVKKPKKEESEEATE